MLVLHLHDRKLALLLRLNFVLIYHVPNGTKIVSLTANTNSQITSTTSSTKTNGKRLLMDSFLIQLVTNLKNLSMKARNNAGLIKNSNIWISLERRLRRASFMRRTLIKIDIFFLFLTIHSIYPNKQCNHHHRK